MAENATRPVSAALPVVVSTSHGTATVMTTFPLSDTAFARPRRASDAGIRAWDGLAVMRQGSGRRAPESNTFGRSIDSRSVLMTKSQPGIDAASA
jgi:hypothetical protein